MMQTHAFGRADDRPSIQGSVRVTLQAAVKDALQMIERDGCRSVRISIDVDLNSLDADRVMIRIRHLATLDL
ncbi:hypothetical protein [Azospirillum picis]|uniref:Uncharacterized protein n=1 Tax=Azospirillum picis TaxID=488438 RepID=A0ABU0MSU7_9PROT|nr:hypothetical protein [Azospirillum picis]MBP2302776.1 hypothetical protein [Azospirillum picis]MDQ0536562.1 hypothetical protein [Azospirillum picis]